MTEDKNTELIAEVSVKGLTHGGAFVADIVSGPTETDSKVVFLREVAPGETVEASLAKGKSWYFEGTSRGIIQASPDRVSPPCEYFGSCGGCDLQHMTLTAQRAAKREMVEHVLRDRPEIRPQQGVKLVGEDLPGWNYRRRVIFHIYRDGRIGFFVRNTSKLIEISECKITDQRLNDTLQRVRQLMTDGPRFKGDLILEQHGEDTYVIIKYLDRPRESNSFSQKKIQELATAFPFLKIHFGKKTFYEQERGVPIDPETHSIPAGHFFQVNEIANAELIRNVCELTHGQELTELFAGAGNFTFPLAKQGKTVHAVEADRKLVRHAQKIVDQSDLDSRIQFYRMSCEKFVRKGDFLPTVLLDPPRCGAEYVMNKIKASPQVNEVVYVSCSLPTLARDLGILVSAGFVIEEVRVLDMFAQTHHVETITRAVRT